MTTDGEMLRQPADLQGQQTDLSSSCGVHSKTEMSGTVPPSAVVDRTCDGSNDAKSSPMVSETENSSAADVVNASAAEPSAEADYEQEQVKYKQMERGE